MKYFLIILFLILLNNCSKPKTVLICGDHVCINKNEAEQYFEENLSIEVKIIDKKKKKEINLVELNLIESFDNNKEINIKEKTEKNNEIKILSNDEIKILKSEIKKKRKKQNLAKKITSNNKSSQNTTGFKNSDKKKNIKKNRDVADVCLIIKKCNIDEISKYLLKQGQTKKFPDITTRE